jgi:hypothetical protein
VLGRTAEGGCPYIQTTRKQAAGGEEAFAEVAGDDIFGVADGGEVDVSVPLEEYIDVRRYILQLRGEQDGSVRVAARFEMRIVEMKIGEMNIGMTSAGFGY